MCLHKIALRILCLVGHLHSTHGCNNVALSTHPNTAPKLKFCFSVVGVVSYGSGLFISSYNRWFHEEQMPQFRLAPELPPSTLQVFANCVLQEVARPWHMYPYERHLNFKMKCICRCIWSWVYSEQHGRFKVLTQNRTWRMSINTPGIPAGAHSRVKEVCIDWLKSLLRGSSRNAKRHSAFCVVQGWIARVRARSY